MRAHSNPSVPQVLSTNAVNGSAFPHTTNADSSTSVTIAADRARPPQHQPSVRPLVTPPQALSSEGPTRRRTSRSPPSTSRPFTSSTASGTSLPGGSVYTLASHRPTSPVTLASSAPLKPSTPSPTPPPYPCHQDGGQSPCESPGCVSPTPPSLSNPYGQPHQRQGHGRLRRPGLPGATPTDASKSYGAGPGSPVGYSLNPHRDDAGGSAIARLLSPTSGLLSGRNSAAVPAKAFSRLHSRRSPPPDAPCSPEHRPHPDARQPSSSRDPPRLLHLRSWVSMVNFSAQLRVHMVPSWERNYIDYESLKIAVHDYARLDKAPVLTEQDEEAIELKGGMTPAEDDAVLSRRFFEDDLRPEIEKIEDFYLSTVEDLRSRFTVLYEQCGSRLKRNRGRRLLSPRGALSLESLKKEFTELYQNATLLGNFKVLNYTGILKIVKKHDKYFPHVPIEREALSLLDSFHFPRSDSLNQLLQDTEQAFASLFTGDSIHIAKAELLVKRKRPIDWGLVELGMRLGCTAMLFVWFLWDVFVDASARPTKDHFHLKASVPVYRALGAMIALVWLWLLNVTVWGSHRINYQYILECDSRTTLDQRTLLREASTLSMVFFCNFLLYFKTLRKDSFTYIPPNYFPLSLFVFVTYKMITPWSHRRHLWMAIWNVVVSPFGVLAFRHSYVADVLTSMVKVLVDLSYATCFFVSGEWITDGMVSCHDRPIYTYVIIPLVHSLPLWFRFMQTIKQYREKRTRWPYLGNALKYAFAQSVIMFGVFKPHLRIAHKEGMTSYQRLWIAFFVCSTLYSFWWDVVMDWGLGRVEHGMLRERLMFRHRGVYWLAIFADFFLRFLWTVSIIPVAALPIWIAEYMDYWMIAFMAIAELFRRSMWGFFRLEWEHLSSTSGGVDLVPLAFDLEASKPAENSDVKIDRRRVILEASAFVAAVVMISLLAATT